MTTLLQELQPNRLIPSLTAGFISGVLLVIYAVSMAALIFSGDLAGSLSAGIGMALWTAIVVSLVVSWMSSVKGVVIMPQDSPAVILSLVASAIATPLVGTASDAEILGIVVVAIATTTTLTGLFLVLLGSFKLGNLTRLMPYPVVGGFLAGVGWLLAQGAINLMTDHFFSLTNIGWFGQFNHLLQWLPGVVFAVVLLVLLRRVQTVWLMPGLLIGGIAVFYVILGLTGTSLEQAQNQGLLLAPFPEGGIWPPQIELNLTEIDWTLLLNQSGQIFSIALLSAMALLLNATGIEMASGQEFDLNQELKATGVANLLAGLGGGIIGFHALGLSVLSCARIKANSRLVGVIAASICALTLFLGTGLIVLIPSAILGGVTFYLGLSFLVEWLYDARSNLSKIDYGLVIVIWLAIATIGFLEGVAIGLGIAFILFMVTYIRMDVVRHQFPGTSYLSKIRRPAHQSKLLEAEGNQTSIYILQGFIFFGTAHQLLNLIRQRLAQPAPALKFLLLDFRLVQGIDASAVISFSKFQQLAQKHDFVIVLTHLSPTIHHQITHQAAVQPVTEHWQILPDLDQGVEWCEEQVIAAATWRRQRTIPLILQLETQLGNPDHAPILMDYLEVVDLDPDQIICEAGTPTSDLYFVESGRINLLLPRESGSAKRVQTIESGHLMGELTFLDQLPHRTTACAETSATLYRLSVQAWQQLQQDHAAVAYSLQGFLTRRLSQQLETAYQEIAVLLP